MPTANTVSAKCLVSSATPDWLDCPVCRVAVDRSDAQQECAPFRMREFNGKIGGKSSALEQNF
jgi:hypothetical protein